MVIGWVNGNGMWWKERQRCKIMTDQSTPRIRNTAVRVVGEEQIKVLEGLGKEEGLLVVVVLDRDAVDVLNAGVTRLHLAVSLDRVEHRPAPVAVLLIVRQPPKHKEPGRGLEGKR